MNKCKYILVFSILLIFLTIHSKPSDNEFEEIKWENVLIELAKKYDKREILDTVMILEKDNRKTDIKVYIELFCLKDSAINLPSKYIWTTDNKLKKFVTHNFAINLKVKSDLMNIDTILSKENIKILKNLSTELFELGTFQDFNLINNEKHSKREQIKIYFSFSIPMTDVGIGLYLIIYKNKLIFQFND